VDVRADPPLSVVSKAQSVWHAMGYDE